jgi:uridine kinase
VVIFVAGLSGSGKTAAATRSGVRPVVPLDSYFLNDQPELPKWLGRTDWETLESYDLDAAASAVVALAGGAEVAVPIYDHHGNARVGSNTVSSAGPFVAEGVYAPEVFERTSRAGIPAVLMLVDVPARAAFFARLRRDVGERHMNPVWALVRSTRLALRHSGYRRSAVGSGAELEGRASAPARIAALAAGGASEPRAWSSLREQPAKGATRDARVRR